jgi:DNA-binding protein HU-beta
MATASSATPAKVETVTLKHLAETLSESHELPKKQVVAMLEDMVTTVTKHLKRGARIRIVGLLPHGLPTNRAGLTRAPALCFFRRCPRGSSQGGATLPQIAVAGVSLHAIVPPRVDTLSELDAPPALAKARSQRRARKGAVVKARS